MVQVLRFLARMRDSDGLLGFCLLPGLVLTVVDIWGVKNWVNISISLFCGHTDFEINI